MLKHLVFPSSNSSLFVYILSHIKFIYYKKKPTKLNHSVEFDQEWQKKKGQIVVGKLVGRCVDVID